MSVAIAVDKKVGKWKVGKPKAKPTVVKALDILSTIPTILTYTR